MAFDSDFDSFGEYLRACRERVTPAQLGLPTSPGVRRTPGLRRDEVAVASGISTDYYTRLEQGRERHPSESVVAALTDAMQLNAQESHHLYRLAGLREPAAPVSTTSPQLIAIADALTPLPTVILDLGHNVRYMNRVAEKLYLGLEQWPAERRNTMRFLFLHPAAKTLFRDWDKVASDCAAHLRSMTSVDTGQTSALISGLVSELLSSSESFRACWAEKRAAMYSSGIKKWNHPLVGALDLVFEVLTFADPNLRMVVYQAAPGTRSHDALMALNAHAYTLAT